MQISSKLLFRTTLLMLGLLMIAALFVVVVNANNQAGATGSTDLDTIRTYVAGYISHQYVDGDGVDGDSGFVRDRAWLKPKIDTSGNMNTSTGAGVLGEGDDAAGAPFLIDSFNQTGVVPGTSLQCAYNSGAGGVAGVGTTNCFDAAEIALIQSKLDARAAAGFSTDIVDYCVTQHTGSPVTGGFGYIAQTGALRSDGSIPNVYSMKWGRGGWIGSGASYSNANPTAVASVSAGGTAPTTAPPACSDSDPASTAGDAELVRCQAQWAIYGASSPTGATGNGVNPTGTSPTQTLAGGGYIDIRAGSPQDSVSISGRTTSSVPINEIFTTTGIAKIPAAPTGGFIVVGRTQMTGGAVAAGLKMLGYNLATNSYLKSGVRNWNNTIGEAQVAATPAYPVPAPASTPAGDAHAVVDTVAPTFSAGPSVANLTTTTVDISRTASEPATTKIHLVGDDGDIVDTNTTILNASKTVSLSGLHDGVHYVGTLTVYDGQANNNSAAVEFTTVAACVAGKPSLSLAAPSPFWASYADYVAHNLSVNWTVNNTGATTASSVQLTGSTATYAPITTITAMPATVGTGTIAPGASGTVTVQYHLPIVGTGFRVVNTASANDCAGNGYTYP